MFSQCTVDRAYVLCTISGTPSKRKLNYSYPAPDLTTIKAKFDGTANNAV